MPRLNGRLTTAAPAAAALAAVASSEPSSITSTSSSGSNARSSSTTPATASSSFRAGHDCDAMVRSGTHACRDAEADEREQLPGSMRVRVLVEDALARPRAHRLGLARIVEQPAVGGERLVGVVDDEQLLPGLEPALDPLVGVRDDRGAGARELERPARGRGRDGRVRAARDVEVDPRRRDRLVERVEGDVADRARRGRCRPGSRVRRARTRAPVRPGSARPPSPPSSRGGTCPRSRRRRRRGASRPASARRTRDRRPRRRPPRASRRARAGSESPPSEFETTRSYSDGSAPW